MVFPIHLRVVSLCMSPVNDSFMSGSLDHSVRIWDLRVNACQVGYQSSANLAHNSNHICLVYIYQMKDTIYPPRSFMFHVYPSIFQGILRLRGRPSVAYDQQGLVFAVAMEGGAIKLFDSRSYDKVPNEHNTGRILYLWKGCKYLSQEYKSNFRVHLILSWLAEIQLKFLTSNLAMMASLCF